MITASSPETLAASPPAEATPTGFRVGRAPLPYVLVERAPGGALFVERGGFGGRPAYVRCERDVALVGTDLTWVVERSRALGLTLTHDPDRLATACLLEAGPAGLTQTSYREISEVPPGTRAEVAPGRLTLTQLSPPRDPGERAGLVSRADLVDRLRAHLFASLERAIEGAASVGVLTGGGLDSGALLAMAHALGPRTNAFAIDFGGPGDDRPHLVALARALGIEPVRVTPDAAPLPVALTAAGMPLTWPSGAAEAQLLVRAREWGASRVLAGLGADQWFDGDPASVTFARVMRHALLRNVPWSVRRLLRRRVRPRVPAWAGPRAKRLLVESHERALDARPSSATSPDERIRAAFFDPHLALASTLRLQLERLSGVLRVDPYLDAELATFALALPPRELLGAPGASARRGLFREALRGVLPESVRMRTDKASFAPVHRALFRAPLLARLAPYAGAARLADLGIIEPRAFRRAFDAEVDASPRSPPDARIYATLAVEAFLDGSEGGV